MISTISALRVAVRSRNGNTNKYGANSQSARLTSGMSAVSNKLTSVIYIKMMHVILYVKLNLAINSER